MAVGVGVIVGVGVQVDAEIWVGTSVLVRGISVQVGGNTTFVPVGNRV
jgi:hypothetical protein